MNRGAQLVALTVLVVVAGAALIKGCGDGAQSDPTAAVENGAPRGLLALELLLAREKAQVTVLRRFGDERALPPPGHAAVLVPPPEASSWSDADVKALLARVHAGDRALVFCDDDDGPRNHRLGALLDEVGVKCERADVPLGDDRLTHAAGSMPAYRRALWVRGEGRVQAKEHAPVFPAWTAGSDDVVVKRAFGAGVVTVVGSATVVANDGIGRDENAAFVLDELGVADGRSVIVDERHHRSRSRAAFAAAALRGLGPLTALAALLLLVPLSLLALAPRPGDPPPGGDDGGGAPAAEAQARALAALLARRKR